MSLLQLKQPVWLTLAAHDTVEQMERVHAGGFVGNQAVLACITCHYASADVRQANSTQGGCLTPCCSAFTACFGTSMMLALHSKPIYVAFHCSGHMLSLTTSARGPGSTPRIAAYKCASWSQGPTPLNGWCTLHTFQEDGRLTSLCFTSKCDALTLCDLSAISV